MARVCDITGKGTKTWNNKSHSNKKTKRKFKPNLVYKWITLDDGTRVKIKICPRVYKKTRGLL